MSLSRILLILAIIAGLAAGALNFVKVKERIVTLQTNLKTETQAKETAQASLKKTTSELNTTKKSLDETKKNLETTTAEKDKANNERDAAVKRATGLAEELAAAKTALSDAQADLAAYKATGLTPPQILALDKTVKEGQAKLLEAQNVIATLQRKNHSLEVELAQYKSPDAPVTLPATLQGKVLVTDPKWNFVVINVGEDQGAIPRGELLVSRNGQFVAKVKITTVQKDRCIANVLLGPSKLGEPMEGDLVTPAYPGS